MLNQPFIVGCYGSHLNVVPGPARALPHTRRAFLPYAAGDWLKYSLNLLTA